MIAQIRTGLWVRNGFAIRGQLLHYRDFMLRELCYDQDLFILQAALVILDPDTVIVTILDRFGLLGYFSGAFLHPTYQGPQLYSMVQEVLYVFVTIFSETYNACKWPIRVAVRREIVHALAMGPCTFTDLIKRVAERLVDDVCFERVLKDVATYKPPDSTTESGLYELKDDAFDEVNPFFYHYTRNKRKEVDTILRTRLKRKTGIAEPVLVPKPPGVTSGPFAIMSSVFESDAVLQIMFYSLYNVLVLTDSSGYAPPSSEAILDQAMYLIMLALCNIMRNTHPTRLWWDGFLARLNYMCLRKCEHAAASLTPLMICYRIRKIPKRRHHEADEGSARELCDQFRRHRRRR
jgi:E3 ubiquitin-protein ligase UBR1